MDSQSLSSRPKTVIFSWIVHGGHESLMWVLKFKGTSRFDLRKQCTTDKREESKKIDLANLEICFGIEQNYMPFSGRDSLFS